MGPFGRRRRSPVVAWAGEVMFDFEVRNGARDGEELVPEGVDLVNGEESAFVGFGFDEGVPEGVEVLGCGWLDGGWVHEAAGAGERDHGRVHF